MKIELGHILYTVIMVVIAFLGAVIVTKTLSKWLKLDEKIDSQENET